MKTKLAAVKNFVIENKVAIITTAVAVASVALVVRNQNEINKFLDEKGLTDEFYNQD